MEEFFDRGGPWGRQMMCGTASVQVCLDAGDDAGGPAGYRSRWRLLHAIGPVLVAAFANSPLRGGRPTGWLLGPAAGVGAAWTRAAPGRRARTARTRATRGPRTRWTPSSCASATRTRPTGPRRAGLTFRDWLRGAAAPDRLRPPTAERPGLPPVHPVPAGPPARAPGAADDRRAARRRLDRARWRSSARWPATSAPADAALAAAEPLWAAGRRMAARASRAARTRGCARPGPGRPTRASAEASRQCFEAAGAALDRTARPGRDPAGGRRLHRALRADKTDVRPTTNWRKSPMTRASRRRLARGDRRGN